MRRLIEAYRERPDVEVEVVHRSFALAPEPEDLVRMFGSKEQAKREILGHWRAANMNDDEHRIRADVMASRPHDYPYSLPGLLACQAAAILGGEEAHGRYFDRLQHAHLTECLDITRPDVLVACAEDVGLDGDAFRQAMESEEARRRVESDLALAAQSGIHGVPALVLNDRWLISGAQPYEVLQRSFDQVLEEI